MIRVIVELVPYGDEQRARVIGEASIVNDGSGDAETGHYYAKLRTDHAGNWIEEERVLRNYSRRNGFWKLLSELTK